MSKCLFCYPVDIHATKEEIIDILLSDEYRALLEYYRSVLEDDPDYLRFHGVSTSFRLCSALKLQSFPRRSLAYHTDACSCSVVEALEGAIKRLESEQVLVEAIKQPLSQWSHV
jgi:hypothetical protein